MSKFFKALERAEQERALRSPAVPPAPTSANGPAVHETVPPRALQSSVEPLRVEPSRGVSDELEEHLVSLLAPTTFAAEQYRALRHLIEQLHKSAELSVVAVCSPGAADGKTTTAINLAGALAQAPDARVLLVDTDLRGAALATHLGLEDRDRPGLVDVILDPSLTLAAVAQVCPQFNLSVLPAGRLSSTPYEVLKSPRAGELLAEARRQYDYIVLDTPPVVLFPECRVIGKWADGVLMVVAAHKTARKLLDEALNIMEAAKIVGFVFNGDDRHVVSSSYPSREYSNRVAWQGRARLSRDSTRRR